MPEVISFEVNTITLFITALYIIVFILFLTIDDVFDKNHKVINFIVYLLLALIYTIPPICLIAGCILSSQALIISWIVLSIIFFISCCIKT